MITLAAGFEQKGLTRTVPPFLPTKATQLYTCRLLSFLFLYNLVRLLVPRLNSFATQGTPPKPPSAASHSPTEACRRRSPTRSRTQRECGPQSAQSCSLLAWTSRTNCGSNYTRRVCQLPDTGQTENGLLTGPRWVRSARRSKWQGSLGRHTTGGRSSRRECS